MSNAELPTPASIPDFISSNPDALAAYMRGISKATYDKDHPDEQLLPLPKVSTEIGESIGHIATLNISDDQQPEIDRTAANARRRAAALTVRRKGAF